MFDKVKAGARWGSITALVVVVIEAVTQTDLQGLEGEVLVITAIQALLPVVVGWFAAYSKRERTGYGSVTSVVTTGEVAAVAAPEPGLGDPQREL